MEGTCHAASWRPEDYFRTLRFSVLHGRDKQPWHGSSGLRVILTIIGSRDSPYSG